MIVSVVFYVQYHYHRYTNVFKTIYGQLVGGLFWSRAVFDLAVDRFGLAMGRFGRFPVTKY